MLDIEYIRNNTEAVKNAAVIKGIKVDIEKLLDIDEKRRGLIQEVDDLRAKRRQIADQVAGGKGDKDKLVSEGKKLKEDISKKEGALNDVMNEYNSLMAKVPTVPAEDTPPGKDESENVEVFRSGEPTKFKFEPKDHIELAKELDLIDFEAGSRVAGYRGYYLKNEAVTMQMALMMHAMQKAMKYGFKPMIPPTLVREFALFGTGYFAGKEYDPEVDEIYKIANDEKLPDGSLKKEDKFLVGTAEPSLLAYFANETLDEKDLPLKICGLSQCYRSEIGSYGKDTKGLYRVHEFMKVELVALTPADVDAAEKMQQEMVDLAKELHEDLGIPYRVIRICAGDLTAGKYKQFDLEMWTPSRDGWGETGSASNFVDWQSRRLNARYKDKDGEIKPVYMLNATAMPSPRPLIAIIENNQTKEGEVKVPKVLQSYVGKKKIKKE